MELRALARRDPVAFAREVLNHRHLAGEPSLLEDPHRSWELDDFQVDILQAFADVWRAIDKKPTVLNHGGRNYLTIRAGHGPGKTHLGALLAHVFNAAFDGRVIVTAPKFDQVKTRFWTAFRRVSQRAEPWYQHLYEINDTAVYWFGMDAKTGRVTLDKEHCMLAETANKPENLAGHHAPFQLVIVDEASGVPEAMVPTILGALSVGVLQILVLISNPTREQGFFADSHRKRETESQFFRYRIGVDNSKRMNSASARAWADKLIAKYGANSPVIRVRVNGEFPGSSPNQLIALEWIEAARNRELDPMTGDGSLGRLRVSVDCGAGGTGETVCTAVRRFDTVRVGLRQTRHSFQLATASIETADAAEKLFTLFGGRKELDDFVVDSLGVGVGAAGELIRRGYRVVLYQGGAASDDPVRWRCRRVQSYLNLRNDLRDGGLAFLDSFFEDLTDWDDFDGQLCSIQTPAGAERVEDLITKKQMTEMGIPSPDLADSLAMQYATQAPRTVPGTQSRRADTNIDVGHSSMMEGYLS